MKVEPSLRDDDLPSETGQEFLALVQAQTQGAQTGKGFGPGDPHDVGAVFFTISPNADHLTIQATLPLPRPEYRFESIPCSFAPQSRGGSDTG